ncbi:hypothetical protein [Rhizobium jaguaris]|uniref:Uncharacterized protein n=1 Tax=Rhizobium jaguaris TaxID=1312183 RepID=A0A387FRU1_9HYPH|nr:hypothetical protein [Rhizobium jaguaris]AYG60427.1 hypothetical protein CCGE525_17645 [Rhizobium jaguaris]
MTFTMAHAALTAILWIFAGVSTHREMLLDAKDDLPDDVAIWFADELPTSARLARATVFCLFLATWPVFLVACGIAGRFGYRG